MRAEPATTEAAPLLKALLQRESLCHRAKNLLVQGLTLLEQWTSHIRPFCSILQPYWPISCECWLDSGLLIGGSFRPPSLEAWWCFTKLSVVLPKGSSHGVCAPLKRLRYCWLGTEDDCSGASSMQHCLGGHDF